MLAMMDAAPTPLPAAAAVPAAPGGLPRHAAALLASLADKTVAVGIIGLGYVGLPLAVTTHAAGLRVIAYDADASKVEALRAGRSYIRHIPGHTTASLAASPRFTPTSSLADLTAAAVVVLCLPTPVGGHNEPDMSYVTGAAAALRGVLAEGALVVLESTTYPGATDEELVSILTDDRSGEGGRAEVGEGGGTTPICRRSRSPGTAQGGVVSPGPPGLLDGGVTPAAAAAGVAHPAAVAAAVLGPPPRPPFAVATDGGTTAGAANGGTNPEHPPTKSVPPLPPPPLPRLVLGTTLFLAYSPEREDPGNATYTNASVPKLVGGVDAVSGDLAVAFYTAAGFASPVRVSSARVAECAKLVENTFRAVNIALVNELKLVFSRLGVDVWEVLAAADTKPFGYMRFDPGPGIGGHCIPVDPWYLAWKAREVGGGCAFIELAAATNAAMPAAVVGAVSTALNGRRRAVNGSTVLLVGVAYKAGVDDVREAPALVIWDQLVALGALVCYHDPYVPVLPPTRRRPALAGVASVPWTPASLVGVDAVVVVTYHRCLAPWAALTGYTGPVIDTRNCVPTGMGLDIVRA
ncbi:hypothetical protein MMPV_000530 [Pyropia vietnamensis]